MPGIDDIKKTDIQDATEKIKDITISPEEEKKVNKAFSNQDILTTPDFSAATKEAQKNADINAQNTINSILTVEENTRKNTQDITEKYGLHFNINYWWNTNELNSNENVTYKKFNENDIFYKSWKTKIDDIQYAKISESINQVRSTNGLITYCINTNQNPSELIEKRDKLLEQIKELTGITDSKFWLYLDKNATTLWEDSKTFWSLLNTYLSYWIKEWKNELTKNVVSVLKNSNTPFEDIKNNFSNSTEDEKIEIAKMFASLLNENYDFSLTEWIKPWDVSDIDMAQALKTYLNTGEKMPAGVCRHIHSATAQLLQDLGLEAWLISTNSYGAHAITLWKKKDGSYFLIDYGNIYEWKNVKELQAKYMALHGSMDLWETIATPDGKVIWFVKTFLEEQVWKNASALWTTNTATYSKTIAEQWSLNKIAWPIIDANMTTDKDISIAYQNGGEKTQIGVNASKTNSNEWNLTSIGVSGKLFLGKDNTWAIWAKISKQNIDYTSVNPENTQNFSGTTVSISWEKVANIYKSATTNINAWVSTQLNSLLSNRDNKAKWFHIFQDAEHESAATLVGTKKIWNFNIQTNVGVKEITDFSNQRADNSLKPYFGFQTWGAAMYNFNTWGNIGVSWEYSSTVWERVFSAWLQGTDKSWKTNVSLNYTQTTPTIAFLEKEIKINLWLTRSITENAQLYINWVYEKNKSQIMAGFKLKF